MHLYPALATDQDITIYSPTNLLKVKDAILVSFTRSVKDTDSRYVTVAFRQLAL